MADNKQWFKVWVSILTDPQMGDLHNDTIGAWVRLGALVAQHGEKGTITISKQQLKRNLHLYTADDEAINVTIANLKKLNITVKTCNDGYIVTFLKWHKYQVDNSAPRVAEWRKNVTVQEEKRREEKRTRKEENKRFTRPTLEDVKSYCLERKNGIDPQAFIDHYEANGWRRGNTPIKDWKACIRTWEAKRKEGNGGKPDVTEEIKRINSEIRNTEILIQNGHPDYKERYKQQLGALEAKLRKLRA